MRQLIGTAGWLDVQYTYLRTQATALAGVLSKYVLDYAPHNTAVSGGVRVPLGVDVSMRFGWTERNDGRTYQVVDLRARSAKIAGGDFRDALPGIVHRPDAPGVDAARRPGAEDR
jgi:hypothetical protein